MAHERYRRFDTGRFYPGQGAGHAMCMAVRAGGHVVLRSQSGFTLDGVFTGPGDAAAQADQAMQNVRILLAEAGAAMAHICKITTYVTDRAWHDPVSAVITRHLAGAAPAATALIVAGLAAPEMLVAIDVDAMVPAS